MHQEEQQQATIAAENAVIATIGKQQSITQEIDHAHHSGVDVIDNMYRVHTTTPATGYGMSPIPGSAGRSNAVTCQSSRTKYYRLTAQECDDNTAQLIDLQSWVRAQAAVK